MDVYPQKKKGGKIEG